MNHAKRLLIVILALLLTLSLAACGGGASEPTPEPTPEPAAKVDPAEIEWGYEALGLPDKEHWYVDGVKSQTDYIFMDANYLTVVHGEAGEPISMNIQDMHLVDMETGGTVYDFVFTDMVTCYELVSKTWYKRADLEAVTASLSAKPFVSETGKGTLILNADGTMSFDYNGDTETGTWWLECARMICYREPDGNEVNNFFNVTYNDADWGVASLDSGEIYYPEG